MLVTCPSGLSFQARKWRIGDRRNLHDQQVMRQGLLLRKMLEAVDEGIEDPGPYPFEANKPVPWNQVCLVDIIDALIILRVASKPMLDYDETCQNCGSKIPLTVDLREREVSAEPMSAEAKQHLSSSVPIERTILLEVEGDATVDIKLRMISGEDLPKIAKFYKQDPTTIQEVQIVLYIASLTPAGGKELTSFREIHKFYAEQDWYFQEAVEDEVVKLSGGMDTSVEMFCKRCNAEQQGTIPFGGEFATTEEAQILVYGDALTEETYVSMVFNLLYRKHETDYLSLSLADVNDMDESLALMLMEKLREVREDAK